MSLSKRLGAWLISEKGRKFSFGLACTGTVGVLLAKTLPNTLLIEQYKDVVRFYKKGFTVPVTKAIQERFSKTLELLEIPEKEKMYFQPFFSVGFDVFSAGSAFSKNGAIIGIPIIFTFIDSDEVDKSIIKLRQESIPWELDDGKLLLKSLFISEKGQMYAMAREIEMTRTSKFFLDTIMMVTSFMGAYVLGHKINTKFNLYSKSRAVRFVLYSLVSSFVFLNYCLFKDIIQLHYEKTIDEYLKNKNEIFREGGKEYYDKVLSRNIALRGLLGKEGQSLYTTFGNENYLFRQKHLPIVQRKEFFENSATEMA